MKPLQVLVPALNCDVNERDLKRTLQCWNGETTVYLLPETTKYSGWREEDWHWLLALPAEHLERIDFYHVGDHGFVVGPDADKVFPNSRADGLLDAWLNSSLIEFVPAPCTISLRVPEIGETVTYCERQLPVQPKSFCPVESVDESGHFTASWSPNFQTVSPDAESEERYGPFRVTEHPIVESLKDGSKSFFCVARWPEPLAALIPKSAGMDIVLLLQQMRQIAQISSTEPARALQMAKDAAGFSVSEGHTRHELGWFWPTLLGSGEEAVMFGLEDFGIASKSIKELSKDDQFQKLLAKTMKIRRAIGVKGLFWALFIERLENSNSLHFCQNCGRQIQGKKGKKYCSREDNPQCFLATQAARQRKHREN